MSIDVNNKTSILVASQLPEFIRQDYPTFVRFLEAYYEFLENKLGNNKNDALAASKKMYSAFDLDDPFAIQEFEEYFFNNFLPLFPRETTASKSLLVKNAIPLYLSKGNEKSVRYFFRALFGDEIDFTIPNDDVLIASAGKWKITKVLRTTDEVFSLHKSTKGGETIFKLALPKIDYPQDPIPPIKVAENEYTTGELYEVPRVKESYRWKGISSDPSFNPQWNLLTDPWHTRLKIILNDNEDSQLTYLTDYTLERERNLLILKNPLTLGDELKVYYDFFDYNLLNNRRIFGVSTNANAIVETSSRVKRVDAETFEFEINDKTRRGNYLRGENFKCTILDHDLEEIEVYLNGFSSLSGIRLTNGGSSYNVGDPVMILGGNPTLPAEAIVAKVYQGIIDTLTIVKGGAGFRVGELINSREFSESDFLASVYSIDTSGRNTQNTFTFNTDLIYDLAANTIIDANYRGNLCFSQSNILSPNVSTRLKDVFSYSTISNLGPVNQAFVFQSTVLTDQNITIETKSANVSISNSRGIIETDFKIRSLGSIGKVDILNGGSGYQYGDKLKFINQDTGTGVGARASIIEVNESGTILQVQLQPAPPSANTLSLSGTVTVIAAVGGLVGVQGVGTSFVTQYMPGDKILIAGETRKVRNITNNIRLNVTQPFSNAHSGQAHSRIRDSFDANVQSGNNLIVGTGSWFDNDFKIDDDIIIFNQNRTINAIFSNTEMTVTENFTQTKVNTEIGLYGSYAIGGQGYQQDRLPIIEVESETGVGAHLHASAIMSDGDEFSTRGSNPKGEILDIDIIDFGLGYKAAPSIDLSEYGDGKATATAVIGTSIFSYPGRFLTTDGHPSSDKLLQDSYLFNTGTYILKTKQEFVKYKSILTKLLNPAGTLAYAEFIPDESSLTSNNSAYVPIIKTIRSTLQIQSSITTSQET